MNDPNEHIRIPGTEELERYGAQPESAGSTEDRGAPADGSADVDWREKFLRAKADLQNYQRRAVQEQQTSVRYAVADFARSLLEVVDDLQRTLQAAEEKSSPEALVTGVRLVYEKLLKVLTENQVRPIEALGRTFDPKYHEALLQQPSHEPDNTVIQEVQRGYTLHDRVLRPARVVISKSSGPRQVHPENTSDADL